LPLRYYYEQNKSINEKELRPTGLSSFFRSDYSFLCDPFKLAQCWRSSLSASLRREFWNMTAITNALSTAATGSSQGYAVQSCSPQQASGTPTSSINSKIMMTTSGLP
ncbi:MAG: hypothetical protein ACLRNW_30120, partial [Neglectibacter sp.]